MAFDASVRVPGSKSLANRALLVAALAPGEARVTGLPDGDDTQRMRACLSNLGFALTPTAEDAIESASPDGAITATQADLFVGNAGTVARFLTAAGCLGPAGATYQLDGIARMRQRPIAELVDTLRELGATIDYLGEPGYPPLRMHGGGLRGGAITLPTTASSQFVSALLLAAPRMHNGLDLTFRGPVTSQPYVAMTLQVMAAFGVKAEVDDAFTRVQVAPGPYRATDYRIEPDASNASYLLAAAALIPGSRCTIEGLGRVSIQGDLGIADLLHQMGAGLVFGPDFVSVSAPPADDGLQGIDVDLNAMPDMVQTLAVVALFARGATRIRNVGNLRLKETDRIAALRAELTRVGAGVRVDGDDLTITPPASGTLTPAAIETYDDHRMAMAFTVAGLRGPGISILDPACVNKTWPGFFETVASLGTHS